MPSSPSQPLTHNLRAPPQFWCVGPTCPQINVPGTGVQGQWAYVQFYLGIGETYQ